MPECATDRQTWLPHITSCPSRISKTINCIQTVSEFHVQILSGLVRPYQHITGNNFCVTVFHIQKTKVYCSKLRQLSQLRTVKI